MFTRHRPLSRMWLLAAAFALATTAGQVLADPPGRVARLSHIAGDVSFQPGSDGEWIEAGLNRPLITGDGLYTDRASRVEMEIGAASIRLDERTTFKLLNLDDNATQIEITEGVLNLRVRRVFDGESYEIDTPTLAFVIDRPGQYRVDIAPDGDSTMISVFDGGGSVYGENNASYTVRDGLAYRFHDSALRDYEELDLPREDDFDRWCFERDGRYERSESRRYVSEDVIGYADLDDHGSWSSVDTYGSVWFPSRVDTGWAPYRNGRWTWIDPWGWSWVDNSAWGFAPFHYGRWAYVGTRWGWVPGPRNVRPIYAPALVAFVGGSNFGISVGGGGPVGWFPLGPRDVYVPWYRGSRDYFNNINVRNTTIINNTYITNVYNDYSRGRNVNNFNYAYRNNDRAFTAIPRDAFVNARQVDRSLVRMDRAQIGRGEVLSRVDVKPVAASFAGGGAVRGRASLPSADVSRRAVIARTAPPARTPGVQNRLQAIERNGNQPLAASQMRDLSVRNPQRADAARPERVRVVGEPGKDRTQAQPLPTRTTADRARSPVASPGANPRAINNGRVTPIERTPSVDARAPTATDGRAVAPDRKGRLPSAGYVPGRENGERGQTPSSNNPRVSNAPQREAAQARRPAGNAIERGNTDADKGIAVPQRRVSPRENVTPIQRETPSAQPVDRGNERMQRREPRAAPVEQSAPMQRAAPVQREAPRVERRAPPQEVQQREVQQREVAPRVQQQQQPQREMRQQREVQQQPRPAPQQQQQPAPQQQRSAAPQRKQEAPPEEKEDNKGRERKRDNR